MLLQLEETDSTNNYLKQLLSKQEIEECSVVIAEKQTSGRGQRGNSWESEPGKNLTFSIVLYPHHIPASRQFALSQIISLGIIDILQKFGPGFSIKWPNDIYWNEKKLVGILIENELTGHTFNTAIVGIGINVNQELFLSTAPNPISLKQITGKDIDRYSLLSDILNAIMKRYYHYEENNDKTLNDSYMKFLFRNNGTYFLKTENELFKASIKGIENDGHLILETENGEERKYAFKEVSYVL